MDERRGKVVAEMVIPITVILAFGLIIFRDVIPGSAVLFTTDANLGSLQELKSTLPLGFFGFWKLSPFFGNDGIRALSPTNLLAWLLPLQVFNDFIYLIYLYIGAISLFLFLRLRKVDWLGSLCGALVFAFVGSNLTLAYAGHIGKFGVLAFGTAALCCAEKLSRTGRWTWALLLGGAVGCMFLEQQDVALFLGIFVGAYSVYAIIRSSVRKTSAFSLLGVAVATILMVAGPTMKRVYSRNVPGTSAEKPQEMTSTER